MGQHQSPDLSAKKESHQLSESWLFAIKPASKIHDDFITSISPESFRLSLKIAFLIMA